MFSQDLSNIRHYHAEQVQWGSTWYEASKNQTVGEMAWRDNNVVLFASTIGDLNETVVRSRKRPGKNKTGAVQTRREFGDKYIKDLPIPKLIDEYNHHMGGVDQFDQLKSYYDTLFPHRKTWRSIFQLMFDITLVNCYKLSTFSTRY